MHHGTQHLVVQSVKPDGVCARYNYVIQQFPPESPLYQEQVIAGDEIMSVNGKTDPTQCKQELMESLDLHLCVRRLPQPRDQQEFD